jgi:GTPase SAR1 family protein
VCDVASEFKPKRMRVREDIVMKLQDTAGQEKYRSIANSYYKGSHGSFLVFDLTDETS